jgi:hypothetical protein
MATWAEVRNKYEGSKTRVDGIIQAKCFGIKTG